MKNLKLVFIAFLSIIVLESCQKDGDLVPAEPSISDQLSKADKALPRTTVWSDDILFRTVVTPAVFDGDHGNYDKLYAGSFYDGVGLISESKPGNQDYNGGRWNLYVLKDPTSTKYSNATSDKDLDKDDFESDEAYFECPLLPTKGNN